MSQLSIIRQTIMVCRLRSDCAIVALRLPLLHLDLRSDKIEHCATSRLASRACLRCKTYIIKFRKVCKVLASCNFKHEQFAERHICLFQEVKRQEFTAFAFDCASVVKHVDFVHEKWSHCEPAFQLPTFHSSKLKFSCH